jgi:hypothetical protein
MKYGRQAEYGQGRSRRSPDLLNLSVASLGQNCPRQYPQSNGPDSPEISEFLGEPLSIREAAGVIGCSPWTVRQRYLPLGLPHLRSRPNGKLIFYKNQVIHWLLTQQQKGGTGT